MSNVPQPSFPVSREATLPGGAALRFSIPGASREEPAEALPRLEVSGLPGARVALRMGFVGEAGERVRVACVEAPSDRWAPGLEEVVLGVATSFAHKAMTSGGLTIERLGVGAITAKGEGFEQALSGEGAREGKPLSLRGKHLFGFEGESHEALLCTLLCEEPRGGDDCTGVNDAATLDSLVGPPPPSLLVRGVLFAAERPLHAAGSFGLIASLLVAALLAKRPRPRP